MSDYEADLETLERAADAMEARDELRGVAAAISAQLALLTTRAWEHNDVLVDLACRLAGLPGHSARQGKEFTPDEAQRFAAARALIENHLEHRRRDKKHLEQRRGPRKPSS